MVKLFLLRHLKSQWNEDNRFAGWVDNPLSKKASLGAEEIAGSLINKRIDVIYTSPLIRNMETVARVFDNFPEKYPLFIHLDGGKMSRWANFRESELDKSNNKAENYSSFPRKTGIVYISVYVSENLNERYYGKLQGLNKEKIIKQYGEEKAHLWRRAFNIAPPGGESLKDVYKRAVPFFKKYAERDLKNGKNVLIVASHNSLRALVKYIEKISEEKIADVELPFGALIAYEFDGKEFLKYN